MLLLIAALSITLQSDTAKAYLDPRARELVEVARLRRDVVDRSIRHYQTTAKERISVGLRTRFRDRLFYRRETASRIDWTRGGTIRIEALGAREVVPAILPKAQVPNDLENFLPRLAFDPMNPDALLRIDSTDLQHPLVAGSERHYQFRTGDSTTINLTDRRIKLIELRVIPRRRDIHLISGSFWIDAATHSVVQIVFRLAKDFDLDEDDDEGDADDVPGFLKPIRAELQYVTIEYGLMHLRWWMPRLIAAEGMFQMGGIRTPIHYERSYSDYSVQGDTVSTLLTKAQLAELVETLPPAERPCRLRSNFNIQIGYRGDSLPDEDTRRRREERREEQRREREAAREKRAATDTAFARRLREDEERRKESEECAKRYEFVVADSAQLLNSPELSHSIFAEGEVLTSSSELSKLAEQLKDLVEPPWQLSPPKLQWALNGPGLVRYNKVEALSAGARTQWDLGRLRADVLGRIGVADLEPNFEVGLTRSSESKWLRLGAFRRLDVMDQLSGTGSFSASLNAFLFGNDERDWFRTLGAEFVARPPEAKPQSYELRAYYERQRPAQVETDFSVAHLFDRSERFEPNRQAIRANQFGTELTLRAARGQNPLGVRFAGSVSAQAETGDFTFVKPSAMAQLTFPLPFRLIGALEGAAGTAFGDSVPLQSHWFVGGYRSARAYRIGALDGEAFWRARAEVGTQLTLARLIAFGDAAWAGERDSFSNNPRLISVGVGASFLDGLVRVDLARALRGSSDFRLHLAFDGVF